MVWTVKSPAQAGSAGTLQLGSSSGKLQPLALRVFGRLSSPDSAQGCNRERTLKEDWISLGSEPLFPFQTPGQQKQTQHLSGAAPQTTAARTPSSTGHLPIRAPTDLLC